MPTSSSRVLPASFLPLDPLYPTSMPGLGRLTGTALMSWAVIEVAKFGMRTLASPGRLPVSQFFLLSSLALSRSFHLRSSVIFFCALLDRPFHLLFFVLIVCPDAYHFVSFRRTCGFCHLRCGAEECEATILVHEMCV